MLQRLPRVTKSLDSHELDGLNHWTQPSSSGERLPIRTARRHPKFEWRFLLCISHLPKG